MNERIAELQTQCIVREVRGTTAFDSYMVDRFDTERFAQLIVKECCDILDPGEHQLIARFQARKWLQEHFEVKE
jgi:hypothetical protein